MNKKLKNPSTFISGHRNPDIDSLAAAAALAALRSRHSDGHFIPICPGVLPERARYLFEKFHIKPPLRPIEEHTCCWPWLPAPFVLQ